MDVAVEQGPRYGADAPGFDDLWHALRLPMLQLAVLLIDSRDVAEDVVQDAFAALHKHSPVGNPAAYLRTSVVNGCRSVLRRRRVARAHVPFWERPGAGADEALLLAEEHRAVAVALRRLPGRQREVLVLKYWAGLDDDAIAAELGVSLGTVRSCASRGRSAIAAMLEARS